MVNVGREISELQKAMEESEWGRLLREIEMLETTYHIFTGNYGELRKLLELYSEPQWAIELWGTPRLQIFLEDVLCRLHNYVAATMTLVDHTRIFVRKLYDGHEFLSEYEEKKDATFVTPLPQFMQGLRNYMMHRGLPFAAANLRGGEGGRIGETRITLDLNRLRSWDGWKSKAKVFLEQSADQEPLDEIVSSHFKRVEKFYEWFGQRQYEIHAREVAKYERLRQEALLLEERDRQQGQPSDS